MGKSLFKNENDIELPHYSGHPVYLRMCIAYGKAMESELYGLSLTGGSKCDVLGGKVQ